MLADAMLVSISTLSIADLASLTRLIRAFVKNLCD